MDKPVINETNTMIREAANADDIRTRIIVAAAGLIASGGSDAATTRAIAAAAAVQAPTIYRIFGDKRGLLDAVAEHVFTVYVEKKSEREPHPDPVQALRDGWDAHVTFGLTHPELFVIMSCDPLRPPSPAVVAGLDVLRRIVRNIALAGRLSVSEARAITLLHSVCVGTVLTLLGEPEEKRDPGLSETARGAVISAITSEAIRHGNNLATQLTEPAPSGMAAALRASLDQTSVLTDGERHLLNELLDRIANGK